MVRFMYFAKVKELVGKSEDLIELGDLVKFVGSGNQGAKETISPEIILEFVLSLYPSKAASLRVIFKSCSVALNDEYMSKSIPFPLDNKDEISIIPPVSGG